MINLRSLGVVKVAIAEYTVAVDTLVTKMGERKGAYEGLLKGERSVEEIRVRNAAEQLMTKLRRLRARPKSKSGNMEGARP